MTTLPPLPASSLAVAPEIVSLDVGAVQAFAASVLDQFGGALAVQPSAILWMASGGGSIESSGVFTSSMAGGPFVITAEADGFFYGESWQ